jgi:hypothetical protein
VWFSRKKSDPTAELLYKVLVADAPRGYAKTVAEKMGIPYPTLSKYWLGKRRFPAMLVRPLFLATDGDPRVAEYFLLEGSGFRLERAAPIVTLDQNETESLTRLLEKLRGAVNGGRS